MGDNKIVAIFFLKAALEIVFPSASKIEKLRQEGVIDFHLYTFTTVVTVKDKQIGVEASFDTSALVGEIKYLKKRKSFSITKNNKPVINKEP